MGVSVEEVEGLGMPDGVREPRRRFCPSCRKDVLEVPMHGDGPLVLVEVPEIEPYQRCPTCLSARQRDATEPCWRCKAKPFEAGWIGEDLRGLGVAVSAEGVGRPYVPRGALREAGEAIHRAHRCGPSRL